MIFKFQHAGIWKRSKSYEGLYDSVHADLLEYKGRHALYIYIKRQCKKMRKIHCLEKDV